MPDEILNFQVPVIPADEDVYHWRAVYRDHSILDEVKEDGTRRGFREVDVPNLRFFVLVAQRPHLRNHILSVSEAGYPIYFRRRKAIPAGDGSELLPFGQVQTCLGWKRNVAGVSVEYYTYYFEDGSTFVAQDERAIDRLEGELLASAA